MNFGTHSTVEYLALRLLHRWVPKWYDAFSDPAAGGFYERLGHGFQPVLTGTRRLLTQCRQLSIYSHAVAQKDCPDFRPDLAKNFDHIVSHYHDSETGLWWFSVDDEGNVSDRSCDLYALCFVIFAFSHYGRASGDQRAHELALSAIRLIDTRFRMAGLPGFAEAVDSSFNPLLRTRRQNPHMHLLESCLFAYESWGDAVFLDIADEMVGLFYDYFFDAEDCALSEFFTDDLRPHPEQGRRVEPGHYFEWVWLLKQHAALTGQAGRHDEACLSLLNWANKHGWDSRYGGIYDVLSPDGTVLVDTKRLWPFTEALKANSMMLDSVKEKEPVKKRIAEMVAVFRRDYMQERGFWVEWLSRDLEPQSDYMPGTTPYHVYLGIMETLRYLHARGYSVSLSRPVISAVYKIRRRLSGMARRWRHRLKRA